MKTITFQGNPLTLVGREIEEKSVAPDFKVVSQDLKEITLSSFKDKIKVITSFPSLDTPVCDLQVKEFNKHAASLSGEVVVLGISMDLPFAQKRFCELNEIKQVEVFSDYKFRSFSLNYGLFIKELGLCARAVIILDKNNVIRYIQVVEELTSAPDYEDVLEKLNYVLKEPVIDKRTASLKCRPCEGGELALPYNIVEEHIKKITGWELVEGKKLVKGFKFKYFKEAKLFVDIISSIADSEGHHPIITVNYNKVKVTLTTHAAGGLTENDFIMAKIIDKI